MIIEARPFKIKVPNELQPAQRELEWFFQEGESACGIKSNFDAFIQACKTSITHEEADAEDQLISHIDAKRGKTFDNIMHGAHKYSSIDRKYRNLSPRAQRILESFYYEKQYDKSIEQYFGAGIGLVPLTPTFIKLNDEVNNLKKNIIHKKSIMQKIKTEARALYLSSLTEYAGVK